MDLVDPAPSASLHSARRQWTRLDAPPGQLFQRLVRLAACSLSAEGAFVAFSHDERLLVLTASGLTLRSGQPAPWADTLLAQVVRAGAPLIIDDAQHDVVIQRDRLGTGAILALPLSPDGTVLAVLCVIDAKPRPWQPELIALVQDAALGVLRELELLDAMRAAEREGAERTAILESAAVGICGLDQHGRLSFINRRAAELLGSDAHALVGRPIREIIPDSFVTPDDCAGALCPLSGLLEGMQAQPRLGFLRRGDGTTLPVEFASYPIREGAGVTGAVVTFTDRSEQQKAAEALKRSEQQLFQSQKIEAVGRLAGGIAHDFNNMLTAISGFAALLDPLPDEETARTYVEEIRKATDRAAALTRQLLAFSRRQVLNPVSLDVNAVIRDMFKLIHRLIGEDIDLELRLDAAAGCALADPSQFEQVLMNLVVNARDAMTEGGKLTIETAAVWLDESYARGQFLLVPGPYVLVAVTDTGCGMDAATLERAFEPFFTTKPASHGTGLGLSTVYGIVKQSNGFVWGYSEPGHGTTFKVYLPQVSTAAVPATTPPSRAPRDGGSGTILLVEDEPAVRLLTRTLLEQCGYHVLEAADGAAALEVAGAYDGRIDLLLTDVVMPKMGGRELARTLTGLRPGTCVIYVSGYAEHAVSRHGFIEEGAVLLQKPYSADALIERVRASLAAR